MAVRPLEMFTGQVGTGSGARPRFRFLGDGGDAAA
jgi:hypothetical protein